MRGQNSGRQIFLPGAALISIERRDQGASAPRRQGRRVGCMQGEGDHLQRAQGLPGEQVIPHIPPDLMFPCGQAFAPHAPRPGERSRLSTPTQLLPAPHIQIPLCRPPEHPRPISAKKCARGTGNISGQGLPAGIAHPSYIPGDPQKGSGIIHNLRLLVTTGVTRSDTSASPGDTHATWLTRS